MGWPGWAGRAERPGYYGWRVASSVLLCTDGSDAASRALAAGLELLGQDHDLVLVTVMNAPDEEALTGSGHAGAELTPGEYDEQVIQASAAARSIIEDAQRDLAPAQCAVRILQGDPGAAICQLAAQLSARAIVVGSRGRGGLKRAVLGSVSDHVVRNAPCSVIVTRL
jgi:nucleotide-binding universal stress UspA family protein